MATVDFFGNFSDKADISIFNAVGIEIFRKDNADISSGTFAVDRSYLPTGVYIFKSISNENIFTQKVIIEK